MTDFPKTLLDATEVFLAVATSVSAFPDVWALVKRTMTGGKTRRIYEAGADSMSVPSAVRTAGLAFGATTIQEISKTGVTIQAQRSGRALPGAAIVAARSGRRLIKH